MAMGGFLSNLPEPAPLPSLLTPHVTEGLIKSLKLQLSINARANQVIEARNKNPKSGNSNSKF
jgi:hypothetical protein